MGGSSSKAKSTVDIVTNITTDVSSKVSSACGGSNTSSQSISQVAGGNAVMENVSQSADSTLNLSCSITTSMQNDFASQVSQQLQSQLDAKLSGMGIKNNTETDSDVHNVTNAVTNVKLEDIKNCLVNDATTQSIAQVAGGNAVMKGVSQNAVTKVIQNCVMGHADAQQAINDFDQKYSTTGTSTNAGFDPLAPLTALFQGLGFAGSILVAGPYIVVVCCCLFLIICCMMMMGGGGGGGSGGRGR